jgi:HSP20 family protein
MSLLTRFERFDPFEELLSLRNRMDRMLPRFGSETDEPLFTTRWVPTSDVFETKDAIVIKAELPGMNEADISVQFENGVLTMHGERDFEKATDEKGYHRVERSYGKFFRSFALPPNVDTAKISASYQNGILEVVVPKKEEAKPKSIKLELKKKFSTAA